MNEISETNVFIVYQMGKVGSSALVEALSKAGLRVYQSHFLSPKAFQNVILRFNNPDLSEHDQHHLSSQLQKNLLLYNLLKRHQKYKKINGAKLNVITLTRDPIDWYFANFLQNISAYKLDICNLLDKKWGVEKKPEKILDEDVSCFLHQVFYFYDSEFQGVPEVCFEKIQVMRKEIIKEHGLSSYKLSLLPQVGLLLRPHTWFQRQFEPPFGIDIFELNGLADNGFVFYENDYMKLAVIKYENMRDSVENISNFFDIPLLTMDRVNESSTKPYYEPVSFFKNNLDFSEDFMSRYYSSRYCRIFGYEPKA